MQVRLTDGEKAGTVVDVPDSVAEAWIVSGKASPATAEAAVADEEAADSEVAETPEKPKATAKRRTSDKPETR